MFGHPIQSSLRVSTILKYVTVFLSSYEDGEFEVFFKMCYLTMLSIAEVT
jgi:hypothetical protein